MTVKIKEIMEAITITPEERYQAKIQASCVSCEYFHRNKSDYTEKIKVVVNGKRKTYYIKPYSMFCMKQNNLISKKDYRSYGFSSSCPYNIYTHSCLSCGTPMCSPRTVCVSCIRNNEQFQGYVDYEYKEAVKSNRDKRALYLGKTILSEEQFLDLSEKRNLKEYIDKTIHFYSYMRFDDLRILKLYFWYKCVKRDNSEIASRTFLNNMRDVVVFEDLIFIQAKPVSSTDDKWFTLKKFENALFFLDSYSLRDMLIEKHFSKLIQKARNISLSGALKEKHHSWKFY